MRLKPKYLQWVLEFLLGAYLTGPSLTVYFFKVNGAPLVYLAERLARAHYPPGAVPADIDYQFQLAFDLLWCITASATFIVLHFVGRFPFASVLLRKFGGIAAVMWLPVYWLCFSSLLTALPYLPPAVRALLAVEVLVIALFAYFYATPRRAPSARVSYFLLLVHSGIWLVPFLLDFRGWGFDRFSISWYHVWFMWRQLGRLYYLLGICSTVIWALYIRTQDRSDESSK